MADRDASVVIGDTYEALALLYRQIQADYGLTALDPSWSALTIPDELRQAADWFFRGDIALGMNLLPYANRNGWHSLKKLSYGLQRTDPVELAAIMLRSPDATPAQHRRRDREITEQRSRKALLAKLEGERFDVTAAENLLGDPKTAKRELLTLVRGYQKVVSENDLLAALRPEATAARNLLATARLDDVAQKLFPQWRFAHLTTFRSVVLVPSLAMAPFLSFRLTTGEHALIIFPVGRRPSEDVVSALKALAHPQRLEILRMAMLAPITGHALAKALGLTEATVHHHTSLLRAAGLLTSNRDANQVHLAAVPGALDELFSRIQDLTAGRGSP